MSFPSIYSITQDEIDINELLEQITLTSTGAAAIFTGMVRGVTTAMIPTKQNIWNTSPTYRWRKRK